MRIVVLNGSPRPNGNTDAFVHWEDMGIVTAPGMTEKGSMKDSPALKEACELGRSLQ